MRSDSPHQSRSFSERRRRRAIIGWVSFILAIGSWAFVLSRLSFLPAIAITQVDIYGAGADLIPDMHVAASKALQGTYLGIFSRSNAFIYPHGEIAELIASSSPRVDDVKIKRNGLHALAVSVSEKVPETIICADLPDLTDEGLTPSEHCYAALGNGFVFRKLNDSDSRVYNQFYIPDLAGQDVTGTYATSTAKFKTVQTLIDQLNTAGISIHAVLLRNGYDYEFYADNPGGNSIVVIVMDDRAGLDTERDNLIAFWDKMVRDGRAKGKLPEWSEIKLQYPPNVYSRNIETESAE